MTALNRESWLSRVLGQWHLVWLGERSYSLFLTHVAVMLFVFHMVSFVVPTRGAEFLLVTRLLAVVLSMLVAMFVFSGVERRFARGLVTAESWLPFRPRVDGGGLVPLAAVAKPGPTTPPVS